MIRRPAETQVSPFPSHRAAPVAARDEGRRYDGFARDGTVTLGSKALAKEPRAVHRGALSRCRV